MLYGYVAAQAMIQVLKQCGDDLSGTTSCDKLQILHRSRPRCCFRNHHEHITNQPCSLTPIANDAIRWRTVANDWIDNFRRLDSFTHLGSLPTKSVCQPGMLTIDEGAGALPTRSLDSWEFSVGTRHIGIRTWHRKRCSLRSGTSTSLPILATVSVCSTLIGIYCTMPAELPGCRNSPSAVSRFVIQSSLLQRPIIPYRVPAAA